MYVHILPENDICQGGGTEGELEEDRGERKVNVKLMEEEYISIFLSLFAKSLFYLFRFPSSKVINTRT